MVSLNVELRKVAKPVAESERDHTGHKCGVLRSLYWPSLATLQEPLHCLAEVRGFLISLEL